MMVFDRTSLFGKEYKQLLVNSELFTKPEEFSLELFNKTTRKVLRKFGNYHFQYLNIGKLATEIINHQ